MKTGPNRGGRAHISDVEDCAHARNNGGYWDWKKYLQANPAGACKDEALQAIGQRKGLKGMDIGAFLETTRLASKGCEKKKFEWFGKVLQAGEEKKTFNNLWLAAITDSAKYVPEEGRPLVYSVQASIKGFLEKLEESRSEVIENTNTTEKCYDALLEAIDKKARAYCFGVQIEQLDWVKIKKEVDAACGERGLK